MVEAVVEMKLTAAGTVPDSHRIPLTSKPDAKLVIFLDYHNNSTRKNPTENISPWDNALIQYPDATSHSCWCRYIRLKVQK